MALAIDYSAPLFLYRVPGRPKLEPTAWDVETSHFAERFQLFIIIALGESIVVTGATTSELSLGFANVAAFGVAFLITAAFWWLYFSYVAAIAQRRLELSEDRTTMARDGYTFLHVVLVAGIIVSAVGDEIVIAHPTETLHTAELVAVVAGPVIYLVGHVLFRQVMAGSMSGKRVAGVVACVAVGFLGLVIPALAVAALLLARARRDHRRRAPVRAPPAANAGSPRRCSGSRRVLRNPALSERGDLQLVRRRAGSLLGEEEHRRGELARVGGGILHGAGVGDRLDAGVDDQQRDVDAVLA